MEQFYIDIPPKGTWGIIIVCDFDVVDDYTSLLAYMRSFGLSLYNAKKSLNILSKYNTGMCISRDDLKMSIIFISKATSSHEWYSTAIHEFIHASDAILKHYEETWAGEPSAYLVGYMTKELVKLAGEPCY